LTHRAAFELHNRQEIARCGSDKHLIGALQVGGKQCFLGHGVSGNFDFRDEQFACDPWQTARAERRSPYAVSFGDEQIRRGALGHFTTLVQENGLIEPPALRLLKPGQIRGPREDLCAGESRGCVPRLRRITQLHAGPPTLGFGQHRDQIVIPRVPRPLPHSAAIAHHDYPESGIRRLVRLDQFQKPLAGGLGIFGKWNMQQRGIPPHASPVPLIGKQHAFSHPDRAKHSPARKQSNLSWSQQLLGSGPDLFVVQNERIHDLFILTGKLGKGFVPAMLENLLTEQLNPASENIDAQSTEAILRIINAEDRRVAEAVEKEIPAIAKAVDAIVCAFERGGHLFYIGAGTSGRLGVLDAAECPPTFNADPELVRGIIAGGERALAHATEASEDDPASGARDLEASRFQSADVLVGIAASGRTPYVLGAIREARKLGAVTIGISCTPCSELSRAVDIPITPLVGPEVIAGSTRMKAGTATKLVLNMLSTAAFIRLGYVYGNLMVNVQPNNSKLTDRARRIVAQAAGIEYERAAELLASAGNSVRTAILMAKTGADRSAAERRLASAGGSISRALSGP